MKKLTKENKKYFNDIFFDMLNRYIGLDHYYKHDFKVKYSYNEQLQCNKISITLATQWRKDSFINEYYNFTFNDNFLTNFSYEHLYNEGYTEIKRLDGRLLDLVNMINDNVKEFYKNIGRN